ncbi:conjugal transfer protein TraH [Rodentibacter sp. JRC1]|uniref:conjugal transfer protein TraH n=1 Tax=Rodentibacter sp. JRC1 TaxID=2874504 RepID=UPI001CFDA2F3|nr:conjugal transfer protein TraH [Rodentibacter sp. JRC1]GJI56966.1 conjugal transfer protein TraH [Rodentibacter sp. JRC1]
MRKLFRKALVLSVFLLSSMANADVNADLNKFFNDLGGGANYTSPTVMQGQSAGYLTGGAFFARVPTRNIQLISITLPSISAGCGGIDAYLGAFSFINSEQLQAMAKMIMSNAIGYAFDLALETTCPQCKMVMDKLQAMANDINNLNISTCQAAQALVGGIVGKRLAQDQQACTSVASENNMFSDFLQTRQRCGVGGESNKVLNSPKAKKRDEEIPRNTNTVWRAFNRINQVVSNDRELKEMMMTMVGTTIYDAKGNMNVLPSLGVTDELISTLLYGGTATMYRCNDTSECLQPTKSKVTIQEKNGLVNKVKEIISRIYDSVVADVPLKQNEINFINNTRIPIYRHIKDVAMSGADSQFVLNLSQYLALNHALEYVNGLVSVTELASSKTLGSDEEVKQFQDRVKNVRERLSNTLNKVQIQQDGYISVLEQMQILRKQIAPQYGSKLNFGE